jgi:serine/threonine-protein kinase HipA
MNREVEVHADLDGHTHLVGRLWARSNKGRQSASFEYDASWLDSTARFSIDPFLDLGRGAFHTPPGRLLFGTFSDAAPDRWGRKLMQRLERKQAGQEGRTIRALCEIDFLLMVDDEARLGALRFREPGSRTFLASGGNRIPPLVFLPKLLAASDHVIADNESDEELKLLLAPGSSLGGARPKAAVRAPDGRLLIAKFPQADDEWRVESWSYVALELARKAGITTPPCQLVEVDGRSVLLVTRFDRRNQVRIPFLSAMTMLSAADGEPHSYLEIADALRQQGASLEHDHRELWQRILFNVLISNLDDHLRNHGFLYDTVQRGWRLSPVYDLNPIPPDVKPPYLTTRIDEQNADTSFPLVVSTGEYYGLSSEDLRRITRKTVKAVSTWRAVAADSNIPPREIERMAGAFEHVALQEARAYGG